MMSASLASDRKRLNIVKVDEKAYEEKVKEASMVKNTTGRALTTA